MKRDIRVVDSKRSENTTLEQAQEANELEQLSQLDDTEEGSPEIFAGENVREYQGVLPLKGEKYVQERYSIKQGSLIETRGYVPASSF